MVLVNSLVALSGDWQSRSAGSGIQPEHSSKEQCSESGRRSYADGAENSSESRRPMPKADIVMQGMHPNPGPSGGSHSRGQRENVLGKEVGVDDAYIREPMSSLNAALGTKRTIDDIIKIRREEKQITAGENECEDARITRAPRKCIQARNGTTDEQKEHRWVCHNEQCIIAFRVNGLWPDRSSREPKRSRVVQASTDNRGLNPQAAVFTPSGSAGFILPMWSARTPSGDVVTQDVGPKAGADVSEVERSKTEESDAKAIQDPESSGHTDLTATLSSGGLSYVA